MRLSHKAPVESYEAQEALQLPHIPRCNEFVYGFQLSRDGFDLSMLNQVSEELDGLIAEVHLLHCD